MEEKEGEWKGNGRGSYCTVRSLIRRMCRHWKALRLDFDFEDLEGGGAGAIAAGERAKASGSPEGGVGRKETALKVAWRPRGVRGPLRRVPLVGSPLSCRMTPPGPVRAPLPIVSM